MLRVVVIQSLPLINLTRTNEGNIEISGSMSNLYQFLTRITNNTSWLESKLVLPDLCNNVSIMDVFPQMLKNNMTDFILLPLTMTYERFKEMEFTNQIGSTQASVLSKIVNSGHRPKTSLYSFNSVQSKVWFILMSFLMGIILIYRLTRNVGPRNLEKRFQQKPKNRVSEYFFALFVALFLRGVLVQKHFRSFGHRLMFFSWMSGVLLFVTVVCSSIISRLTVSVQEGRIDKVIDIIKYPNLRPILLRDSPFFKYIQDSSDPKLQVLYKQIKRNKGEMSSLDETADITPVVNGSSVIISGRIPLQSLILNNCRKIKGLHLAKRGFLTFNFAIALRRSLPFDTKQTLRKRTAIYVESGLMKKDLKIPKISSYCGSDTQIKDEWAELHFDEVDEAFQLLLTGTLLAITTFFIEMLLSLTSKRLKVKE